MTRTQIEKTVQSLRAKQAFVGVSPLSHVAMFPQRIFWPRFKRAYELVTAATILVITAPVLLAAMALVKLTSTGPAIYSQRRIGLGGKLFIIYKIRTMRIDAEADGPRWCVPGDQRVTGLGCWLRKSHVDELPQLWNILKGEMSLVGPRPERPEFMPKIRGFVENYDARHVVLPGITGLAQVQVDADTKVDNVTRKLRYDLYYIDHSGPWLELKVLFCTALKVAGVSLPTLRSLLDLQLETETLEAMRQAA